MNVLVFYSLKLEYLVHLMFDRWCELIHKFIVELGLEDLMVVSTKMAVFWVVAPCSLVEVYQCFRGPCYLHRRPDDGGSKDL
jgi:hypothetical protein